MADAIERAIERYIVKPLPGNTACVVDTHRPDQMAEFCGTIWEARKLLTERRANAVRAALAAGKGGGDGRPIAD